MAYDSGIISFTTKTDKVDIVAAAHINAVQSEHVIIETILGTNVKGNRADLKTRLNNMMDADGSLLSGASFPSPSLPSQSFYRTDLDSFYIMNAGNSAWNQFGASISNVLFQYSGIVDGSPAASKGEYTGTSLVPNNATGNYRFLQHDPGGSYVQVYTSKFKKIPGISTVTIYCRIWQRSVGTANLKVDIGGQNGNVDGTGSQVTPEWKTFTIDVSSLTNGTVYDVACSLKDTSAGGEEVYCSNIIGFGS